jgi:hypothetical protein
VTRYSYTARVTAPCGAIVTHLVGGSTAGCALTTLRRSLKGQWTRIEVGTGEGADFVVFAEVSK